MQANGAEMLRLALGSMVLAGVKVCAPVHDAVLIEAPTDDIDEAVAAAKAAMREASEVVLNGFQIGTEAKVVRSPDRYADAKGVPMWNRVMRLLGRTDGLIGEQ